MRADSLQSQEQWPPSGKRKASASLLGDGAEYVIQPAELDNIADTLVFVAPLVQALVSVAFATSAAEPAPEQNNEETPHTGLSPPMTES